MLKMSTICKADLILFSVQVLIIFVVIFTSLINLTFKYGNQQLWTVLLTSSLGYLLPNPKIRIDRNLLFKTIKEAVNGDMP